MEPQNGGLEDDFPFQTDDLGSMLIEGVIYKYSCHP